MTTSGAVLENASSASAEFSSGVFGGILTEVATASETPQGLRTLALSATESATAAGTQVANALRQAEFIEDVVLRTTVQQAILTAYFTEPVLTATASDIVMTVSVNDAEADLTTIAISVG